MFFFLSGGNLAVSQRWWSVGQQFCKWSLFHYQQRLRTTARCSSILVVPYPFLSSFFPKQILTQMHFHTGIFHLHWNFVHFSIDNSTHLRIAFLLYFGNFLKLINLSKEFTVISGVTFWPFLAPKNLQKNNCSKSKYYSSVLKEFLPLTKNVIK